MQYNPKIHKLSNGVTVILDPFDSAITAVSVRFGTGARDEKPDQQGITHFCEHMLFKGTKNYKTGDIMKQTVQKNGGQIRAWTSDIQICMEGKIVSENLPVLLDVLLDPVQNALFDNNAIERERGVILDEFRRTCDNGLNQLEHKANQKILPGAMTPWQGLGTAENIKSFTRKQLKMWMARRMTANNCVVTISGGIKDADAILKIVESKVGALKPIDVEMHPVVASYRPGIVHQGRSRVSNILFKVYTPILWSNDFENKYKNMCWWVFNEFMRLELGRVLRANGLVYYVESCDLGPDNYELCGFETQTAAADLEKLVVLVAKTMRDVYDGRIKITDDFIASYCGERRLGDAQWLNNPHDRCAALARHWLNYGRVYDYDFTIKNRSKLNADDIIKNTRGMFDKPVSFVTAGPEYNIDLRRVWDENFGPLPNTKIMTKAKDDKCR